MKRKLFIIMYCTALISCGKDTFVPEGSDTVPENAAAVRIVPSYGTAELKSAAPELIAEIAGTADIVVQESISPIVEVLPTRGTPVSALNFAVRFPDGFRAFAVYSGTTDRSGDLAATFSKIPGEEVWTLVYNDIEWPADSRLRYYFSAPASLPPYIDIASSYDAGQAAPAMVLRLGNGYPTEAAEQEDLLFASRDISLVRGGTVSTDVNFIHVFAGVRVRQGNTGGKFTLTGASITGMPASGTCSINFSAGPKSADCVSWSHPEASPATADFTLNPADGDAIFCIPRSFKAGDGTKLRICYTVEGEGSRTEELDLGTLLDGQSWLAGQMHTYTVTIAEPGAVITDAVTAGAETDANVTNTGNVAGYLRATLAADWVRTVTEDDETVILRNCDLDSEGTFTGLAKHNWIKIGGYYYYKFPVKAGFSASETLFDRYAAGTAPIAGARLQFRIMAQIVPFEESKTSVTSAWGADVAAQLSTAPEN